MEINEQQSIAQFDTCSCCWLALGEDGKIVLVDSDLQDGFFNSEADIRETLEPCLMRFFQENNLLDEARPRVFTADIDGLRCLFTMLANNAICEEVVWIVVVNILGSAIAKPMNLESLTRREKEVYHWLLCAKTNSEIGIILGISERTVGKHCESIYRKLGVSSRMNLLVRNDAFH